MTMKLTKQSTNLHMYFTLVLEFLKFSSWSASKSRQQMLAVHLV